MKISATNLANILGITKRTLTHWEKKGKFISKTEKSGERYFDSDALMGVPEVSEMINSKWGAKLKVRPQRDYTSIELFAGAGGGSIGDGTCGI